MSIEVSNVTKLYGKQKALNHVSFKAEPGQIVGFLGPNGAGKSTMMKIITCFIPQTEGEVKVCGYDVTEEPIEVKKQVGYLPEHNPLYLDMYVKEYLEFIAGIYKVKNVKSRIAEMIEKVGLEVEQNKKIGELSKGYRQRVGLAQALIHDPKVLVLDEPTTGLDPNQLEEIRNLIKEIGKEKTILLSTHIMQEVEAICDKVIIIRQGSIVADDKAQYLQEQNKGATIVAVEFDSEIDQSKLNKIQGVKQVQLKNNNTWLIELDKESSRNNILKFAIENNINIVSINKTTDSLEEVFKKLTK